MVMLDLGEFLKNKNLLKDSNSIELVPNINKQGYSNNVEILGYNHLFNVEPNTHDICIVKIFSFISFLNKMGIGDHEKLDLDLIYNGISFAFYINITQDIDYKKEMQDLCDYWRIHAKVIEELHYNMAGSNISYLAANCLYNRLRIG